LDRGAFKEFNRIDDLEAHLNGLAEKLISVAGVVAGAKLVAFPIADLFVGIYSYIVKTWID